MTNETYAKKRNDLIPQAVKHADVVMLSTKPASANREARKIWSLKWDLVYLAKMNYLARVHNLVT